MKRIKLIELIKEIIQEAEVEKATIAKEMGILVLYESDMNDSCIVDLKNAIKEVTGLSFDEFTTESRLRPCYYARSIYVNYCVRNMSIDPNDLVHIVNRDRCTILRYIKTFNDELKYNKFFREIYLRVNEIINKNVSL